MPETPHKALLDRENPPKNMAEGYYHGYKSRQPRVQLQSREGFI